MWASFPLCYIPRSSTFYSPQQILANWLANQETNNSQPRSQETRPFLKNEKLYGRVGILSFEVANAMSRAANLYRSLAEAKAARLLGPLCLGSHAVRALVPGDDARLLALALAEKLDALNRVAAVATRLGRRCTLPALLGFDHVYADLLAGRSDAAAAAFAVASPSEAAALVRKLDRLAVATAALYAELEA